MLKTIILLMEIFMLQVKLLDNIGTIFYIFINLKKNKHEKIGLNCWNSNSFIVLCYS